MQTATLHSSQGHHQGSRPSRAKRHNAWERITLETGGLYDGYLNAVAMRYPKLTPSERRICALVRGMFPSYEIAKRLCITEKTVENHRVNIRQKLGLAQDQSLLEALGGICRMRQCVLRIECIVLRCSSGFSPPLPAIRHCAR
jgi:DNA-binding CsgD family transcriptional regulator